MKIKYMSKKEMKEILQDKEFLRRLKRGHKEAKALRGKFIDVEIKK